MQVIGLKSTSLYQTTLFAALELRDGLGFVARSDFAKQPFRPTS